MREWCGSAVEVSDQAQYQDRKQQPRTTLRSLRRLAVFTLTLVLVAGVHVAWAPDACAAPAEFLEQRLTLNGLDADLTLERVGADYTVSINYLDEAPARISVTVQQTLYDSSDGDLMSCVDTSWSDNVSLENGRAVFTPTIAGQHATLDLGELPLRSFQRVVINLETSAVTSVVVHAVITDNWGTRHELRTPSRPIAAGTTTVTQNLTYMLPSGSTRPDGLNRIHSLSVSVDGLDPVTIHSVVLTAPSVVRPGDEDLFQFAVPISPSVAFDITVGDVTQTLLLEDLVGAITVAEYVPTPFEAALLRRKARQGEVPDNLNHVILFWWWDHLTVYGTPEWVVIERLEEIDAAGWGGVSLDYFVFLESLTSNRIFLHTDNDPLVGDNMRTPTDYDLERMLQLITLHTDLDVHLRILPILTFEFKDSYPGWVWRGQIRPSSPRTFFNNFARMLEPILTLCNQYGVRLFTPMVEMNSLEQEQYNDEIHRFLDLLDPLFDGWFSISSSTNLYLAGFNTYNSETRFEKNAGTFWNWVDRDGKPLIIGANCNESRLSTTFDPTLDELVAGYIRLYRRAVNYYRSNFPGHMIIHSETHVSQHAGGTSMGFGDEKLRNPLDLQEMMRGFQAIFIGAAELGISGLSIGYYNFFPEYKGWHLIIPDEIKPEIERVMRETYLGE